MIYVLYIIVYVHVWSIQDLRLTGSHRASKFCWVFWWHSNSWCMCRWKNSNRPYVQVIEESNGYESIPMKIPFLGGWTSINPSYDLGWTKGTRVLTHPQIWTSRQSLSSLFDLLRAIVQNHWEYGTPTGASRHLMHLLMSHIGRRGV